jgi:phage tail-like protein
VSDYYPPGAFYFTLAVIGSATALAALTQVDAGFQEISGIRAELDTETVAEGGENRFVHRLPRAAKHANLVLKRGVVTRDSFLGEWVGRTIGSSLALPVLTQNLLVTLLGDDGFPLVAWGFANAYPLRCEVASLDALDNKILTETLEFSYNYFERVTLGSGASVGTKLAQLAARLAR